MSTFQSTPFSGRVPYFLNEVLASPAGSIPKGAQWMLQFEGLYNGQTVDAKSDVIPVKAIKTYGTTTQPGKWVIDDCVNATVDETYQTRKGCVFVQAVQMPGESTTVNPVGDQMNGFLRSYVGGGRDVYPAMKMQFLDTNISFVDNTLRAWVIATSRLGLIARKGDENYRCNFSIWKLGVTSAEEPPTVTQHYTFWGACPIEIDSEEWNYSAGSRSDTRGVSFLYHYYTLDTFTDNKLLQLHKNIKASSNSAIDKPQAKGSTLKDAEKRELEKYLPSNPSDWDAPISYDNPPPGVSTSLWSTVDNNEQRRAIMENYSANVGVYGSTKAAENTTNLLKEIQNKQIKETLNDDITVGKSASTMIPQGVKPELWKNLNDNQRQSIVENFNANANIYGNTKAAENTNNTLKQLSVNKAPQIDTQTKETSKEQIKKASTPPSAPVTAKTKEQIEAEVQADLKDADRVLEETKRDMAIVRKAMGGLKK
jgi:hypothetical protein